VAAKRGRAAPGWRAAAVAAAAAAAAGVMVVSLQRCRLCWLLLLLLLAELLRWCLVLGCATTALGPAAAVVA